MKKACTHLMLALTVALLAGCSASSPDTGSARFAVSAPQALSSSLARVSVTSSAADIPTVTLDLALSNGVWGGIIGDIPAGADRSFHARAFDATGTLLFEGSASGITISANQMSLVAITLQQLNPPPPFDNEAPLIDSLYATATSVPAGDLIFLRATAHDPNPGDTLTYAWSATAGSFGSPSSDSTWWTAPTSTGIQTLTLTVTDSRGLSSSIALAVNVTHSGGEGDALLSISFNSSPVVASLSAAPTRLAVGQTTAVSVSASDPDGDSLSYSWSATCAGSWSNASSSSAQFTPSLLPAGACNNCRLTVSVSDGNGAATTGSVALCVSNTPPTNHLAPVIVRSYRSSDTASLGQVLTYEVVASDPEGSALSFSWEANLGTLGTPTHDVSRSRISWTAPSSCISTGAPPTITVTVTNAFNLTASRSFTVRGLPTCQAHWIYTGSMTERRSSHTATLLTSGKVLVTGGGRDEDFFLAEAELYDPATGTWSPTDAMSDLRAAHTATLLPDGKVLVTGGANNMFGELETAELYDPATGTWSPASPMGEGRYFHTATLLPDGKVLVAGGIGPSANPEVAELYDPATDTWSQTGAMAEARWAHTATLLPDGKVLVVGGIGQGYVRLATAELYDPATGTWSPAGAMAEARADHTATLLPGGKLLITGGDGDGFVTLATAELYDLATGTWSAASAMTEPRESHTATLLSDGKVLVAGGFSDDALATAELYDPATDTWSPTDSMADPRSGHTATLLPNGQVLTAGGGTTDGWLSTAELYTP
ncbi:Kelch repeat-containing protein [Hyalangium gracile]|uniref:Kelch repeat-containing protein n=1 Tax=Hyalangium gracile TaxID=394092 RepID=UPI001CCB1E39|nr:kelch repeat-containing protein [Hyalangium gracile]